MSYLLHTAERAAVRGVADRIGDLSAQAIEARRRDSRPQPPPVQHRTSPGVAARTRVAELTAPPALPPALAGDQPNLPALPERFLRPPLDPAACIDTVTTNLATVPFMPARWEYGSGDVLPDGQLLQVIPRDELTGIAAPGGTGKGMLMALFAGIITSGRAYPNMPAGTARPPGDVIIIAPEDNPVTTLVPRLLAAGADTSRVHDLTMLPSGQKFTLPSCLPQLWAAVRSLRTPRALAAGTDLRMIIIDPVAAAADFQMSSVSRARAVLEPLMWIAQQLGIAVVFTAHTNKDGKTIAGSAAVVDTPRVVWMIERDEDDDAFRVLAPHKGNITAGGVPLRYTITGDGMEARAEICSRESVRAQRMGGLYAAAAQWRAGAYQITSAPATPPAQLPPSGPAPVAAAPRDDDATGRAAKALAVKIGETRDWDDIPAAEQNQFRVMAAAALDAVR